MPQQISEEEYQVLQKQVEGLKRSELVDIIQTQRKIIQNLRVVKFIDSIQVPNNNPAKIGERTVEVRNVIPEKYKIDKREVYHFLFNLERILAGVQMPEYKGKELVDLLNDITGKLNNDNL
jgi:hypothetical protein